MKQIFLSLVFVCLLCFPATGLMAQEEPSPVPSATAETANVGEPGPAFQVGARQLGTAGFVDMVAQDASVAWANLFEAWGYSYIPPTFVTVQDGGYARSNCGINAGDPMESPALSPALFCPYGGELGTQGIAAGIHDTQVTYEPVIYLSLPWLEEHFSTNVTNKDFAVAYMVTYEFSNYIEYLLGYIDHTGGGCCDYTDEQIQLWADCLTGVWAYSAYDQGYLDEAEVEGAQTAAWGDGTDLPEQFGLQGDHGSPDERLHSLMTGYQSGNPQACFEGDRAR